MKKTKYECTYCGNRFEKENQFFMYSSDDKCPKCNDSNLKVIKDVDKGNIFGYDLDEPLKDAYILKDNEDFND
jgi:hypothetical protein